MNMNLEEIYNVYFLGIGGIGMSALARYFHAIGKHVAGYDLTPSAITDDLIRLGIDIHFEDEIADIPESFKNLKHTLIIRTPAVPESHTEYKFFTSNSYTILKRSEVLGLLFNTKKGIAVAGTHGKTSVSSMLAYIMDISELGCNAFLGGILKNTNSNLILNPESDWVVAEADEFDRSFLQLTPDIALVTWVDVDHLDIYSSEEDIRDSFTQFLNQTKKGGIIILKEGIELALEINSENIYTYSLDKITDFYARNIRVVDGMYSFDIVTPDSSINDIKLKAIGLTNVENGIAAAALAWTAGVRNLTIKKALSSFSGVKRRFDINYQDENRIYIDDYAHHPRELDAVIGSVRNLYPNRKLTGVFQPHLYSRTRDFAFDFAKSLSALDELVLLDIYPAREEPIKGISSEIIFDQVLIEKKVLCSKDEVLKVLEWEKIEVLLTMGAGDIDRLVDPVTKMMAKL